MLTVAKITRGAAGGYAEYLEGQSQAAELGDYYLRDGQRVEAPGRWAAGATTFGLEVGATVTGEQLGTLMAVQRPDTGEALRPVGGDGRAVAAIDATFAAPKSVSAVWAVAGPQLRSRLEAAHERAIDRSLQYAVTQVAMVRERVSAESVIHVRPTGVIATSWRHTTARGVEGRAPDPHLHSHVLLHGAVRRDGQVMAIDSRKWFVHRRELGAAYRTELARELTGLGFEIERGTGRGGRYFEIAEVPRGLLDRWSSRDRQIRAAIDQRVKDKEALLVEQASVPGPDGRLAADRLQALRADRQLPAAENRFVTIATRTSKDLGLTHAELDQQWQATARSFSLDPPALERLHTGERPPLPAVGEAELVHRLTEFEATFSPPTARAVALESSAGVAIEEALSGLDRATQTGEILSLADGNATTVEHRARERETVRLVHELSQRRLTRVPEGFVAQETERLDARLRSQGSSLSDEQLEAVRLGCSERQLVVIEGQAGTGKSTVLTAIARAHQSDGRQVVVTSTGALAADRLARELADAGVDVEAYSTARLHASIAAGSLELGPQTTVIHDEAALASTREQQRLLTAIEQSGARLIEVGDPRQSRPVGAGGLWPELEHATQRDHGHVELTRNVRARDPSDRRDQKLFRDGHADRALHGYEQRDRVITAPDQRTAEDRALEAADADRQDGKRTIVIAQTSNDHLDELNARAQAIRLQDNQIGPASVPVGGKPYELHAGDHVQIRRTLHRENDEPMRNGTTGQITGVDEDARTLQLRTGDGRLVTLAADEVNRADVRLAYVQHPFPAQGQTTDTAHLIVAEHATQEGSYVALTRARERTHIYTGSQAELTPDAPDPRAALAEHMSRAEPDIPSIDIPLDHERRIADEHDRARLPDSATARMDSAPLHREEPTATRPDVPSHLASVLGDRPPEATSDRMEWERAASAIETYRSRHGIASDDPRPLGPEPAAGEFQQRLDRTRAANQIDRSLQRLGRSRPGAHLDVERDLGNARDDGERSPAGPGNELAP